MEITTKVVKHISHREGVGKNNGKEWTCDTFLFDDGTADHPQKFVGDVWRKSLAEWLCDNLSTPREIAVSFSLDAREYNGRWFNSLRVYKVTLNGQDVTEIATTKEQSEKAFDEILGMATPPPPTQKEDDEENGELPF